MTDNRHPRPPEIEDLDADMKAESLNWTRPRHKPLEDTIDKSSALERLREKVVPALDVKGLVTNYWSWGQIRHGDCVMSNATLWLSGDGTGRFYAYTKTDDSGDVWLFRGLGLLDNNGVEIYRLPQFNSPRMNWENSWYKTDVNVRFPAYLFTSIVRINMYHHC